MMKLIVVILILVSLFAAPSTSRADAREDYRKQIEQQKKTQEMYAARIHLLPGKKKIEDLLKMTTEANKLAFKSPLFDGD